MAQLRIRILHDELIEILKEKIGDVPSCAIYVEVYDASQNVYKPLVQLDEEDYLEIVYD